MAKYLVTVEVESGLVEGAVEDMVEEQVDGEVVLISELLDR